MTLFLDIDPHGRVAPASGETRTALGERAGRFEVLPSAPDLLLARRAPSTGGVSPHPRVVLSGDLSAFSIADFIAFAHQGRLSGVLHVVSGEAERAIGFKDGEVSSSRSSVVGERIGEVALKLGLINEAQLQDAMARPRPLGKALVDLGLLTSNDLWKCFHEQITAVFHAILLLETGLFWLLDDDGADLTSAPQAVNTQALLMDGIRRIDELTLFQARIPGPGAYLRRTTPPRAVSLRPVEQQVLAQVDGQRTVAQVANAARLGEFDTTKVLFHLAEAGYLEATDEPTAATPSEQGARIAALGTGYGELLRLVVATIPPGARPDFLAAVTAMLRDPSAPFAPLFRGLSPASDGDLDTAALLVNIEGLQPPPPEGEAPRLVAGGLREVLFYYLFLAGDRIPREADQVLGATVRRKLTALEGLAGP